MTPREDDVSLLQVYSHEFFFLLKEGKLLSV